MFIYLKQALQILMCVNNDYSRLIQEILTIKFDQLTLRDINKVIEKVTKERQYLFQLNEEKNKNEIE